MGPIEIKDFQPGGYFSYAICLDISKTPAQNGIKGTGSWTTQQVIDTIEDRIQIWTDAVSNRGVICEMQLTLPANCADPKRDPEHSRNQGVFVTEAEMKRLCPAKKMENMVIGCWFGKPDNTGVDSLKQFAKQSIMLNEDGVSQQWNSLKGTCTHLRDVLTHESGHAYGLEHPFEDEDDLDEAISMQFIMRGKFCDPAGVEIAVITANYQSR